MFRFRGEEEGYGEQPIKPHFNQLPHINFVRIIDKLSSHGTRQRRAIVVSGKMLFVCEATSFKVHRAIDVMDIDGAFKQENPAQKTLGGTELAILLCIPANNSHDLLLLQPREKKAGHANNRDMIDLLRAISYAKSTSDKKLPISTLKPKEDILSRAFLIKNKTFDPPALSLPELLEKHSPAKVKKPKKSSESGSEDSQEEASPISPSRKVSFGGVVSGKGKDNDSDNESSDSSSSSSSKNQTLKAVWQPDNERKDCNVCNTKFTIHRRRHHCRKCLLLVCNSCSRHRAVVPGSGSNAEERICSPCYFAQDGPSSPQRPPPLKPVSSATEAFASESPDFRPQSASAQEASPVAEEGSTLATSASPETEPPPTSTTTAKVSFSIPSTNDILQDEDSKEERRRRRREKRRKKDKRQKQKQRLHFPPQMGSMGGGLGIPASYGNPSQIPGLVLPMNPYQQYQQKMLSDVYWTEFMKEWDISSKAVKKYDSCRELLSTTIKSSESVEL
eukprot:TRINITY_DN34074_c0_g1_i1.p1 TRINITY_DN34074_c0_g1~~TRINITY_DN34074_c0_g1_i1.p1  ORF type:complete len:504 (+),score=103.37 TRINITY_DN34074_c0_g1_i1:94-1605(+)